MSCIMKLMKLTKSQEFKPDLTGKQTYTEINGGAGDQNFGKYTKYAEFHHTYGCDSDHILENYKKDPYKSHDEIVNNTRDSGVHSDEERVQNENRNSSIRSDALNSPIRNSISKARRKEGLIFSRPKLSEEQNTAIPYHEKDQETRDLLKKAIESNDFLNNYMNNDERKEMVIMAMEPAFYEIGSFIIKENDEGSEIYISENGIFDVIKNGEIISRLGKGVVFGELAILYNAKRFASIQAASDAKVWKINRKTFRTIMIVFGSKEREENLNFLRTAPFLRDLNEEVLLKFVDLLKRVFFQSDACIVRQGDYGNEFFIIRGGSVTVKKTNEFGETRVVNRLKRGDYFGEQALLTADCRQASVYADPPGTECLKLDRESFINYLGNIEELKRKPVDNFILPQIKRPSAINRAYDHIQLSDLEYVKTLGAGAFGRVDLVTYKGTHSYALKVIKKIEIIKQDQIDHIYSEKFVMTMCQHCPFIVELYKTFRDTRYVYILMEPCLGGDVWTIMHERTYFDEPTAKFLIACVVEAFDFLHTRNIIYRDLKPENLMLTPDGYCKLVDFGFAKVLNPNYKTNTFVGTPEYLAPEIILDRGHDRAVDYWTLGILIHELLVGKPPFHGTNQMRIFQQILGGIDIIGMPRIIPRSAQILIKQLCKQMPSGRLGYQKNGVADIKRHSWFDGFDWHRLKERRLPSPIQRPVLSNIDTKYFSECAEDTDTPPEELSGWDSEF